MYFRFNHALLCKRVVLAEWKPPVYDNTRGITLVTATTRRNSPNVSLSCYTLITNMLTDFSQFCSSTRKVIFLNSLIPSCYPCWIKYILEF